MFPKNSESNVLEDADVLAFYKDINPENGDIIEQIQAYNELEDMGLLEQDSFSNRTLLLSKLVGGKEQKVWGEYYYVNQNVIIPELFNKAISIPLTKNEVIRLIDDLTKTYSSVLKNIAGSKRIENMNNKVPMRFSEDVGAHFNPNLTEIKFYQYGDWRFGYFGVFCAETVFHEFSHLLDATRSKKTNIDAHDKKFVKILESVLIKYKDWIEERYNRNNLINQIVLNSELLSSWRNTKSEYIAHQKQKEEKLKQEVIALNKQKSEIIEFEDDKYPLSYFIDERQDLVVDYIYQSLTMMKDLGRNIPLINKTRKLIKDDGYDSVLAKEQILLIQDALGNYSVDDVMPEMGLIEQNELKKIIQSVVSKISSSIFGEVDLGKSKSRIINT